MEKVVNKKDPRQIRIMVRKPADLLLYSLSAPINPPTIITSKKRRSKTSKEGILNYYSMQIKIVCLNDFALNAYKTKMQTATIKARITTTSKLSLSASPGT